MLVSLCGYCLTLEAVTDDDCAFIRDLMKRFPTYVLNPDAEGAAHAESRRQELLSKGFVEYTEAYLKERDANLAPFPAIQERPSAAV